MILLAKWIVILFGAFIVYIGFIMLFSPKRARAILRRAGTTNLINYGEITIRLIVAVALILHADSAKYSIAFEILGWFMLVTSLILYAVPKKIHNGFSMKSADILKPLYFQFISPFAFLFGGLIIYNTL
jgi:uncharacterized membrane protein YfcA